MHALNTEGKERLEDVSVAHNQECTTLVLFFPKALETFSFSRSLFKTILFKTERKRQILTVFAWLQVLSVASAVVENVSAKTSIMATHVIRRIAPSFHQRQFANKMQNL